MTVTILVLLVLLVVLLTAHTAQAQTEPAPPPPAPAATDDSAWKNVRFGATLEGYYQYNWNRPPDRVLALRAYDTRTNVFSIQQAAFVIDAAPDVAAGRRYGLRADLQFGQATETVQGSPANEPRPDVYRHLWQVYGSYVFPVGAGLQADFGKFASMLGYETNYAKDNQAFSRAYLFNFLPFYHSGLRLSLPGQRQSDAALHADERHPADGRLQRLQVESLCGDRQACIRKSSGPSTTTSDRSSRTAANRAGRMASSGSSTPT